MNIVYVANDKYAQHLAVSMYSLLDANMAADEIDIYVISTGISEDSAAKLKSITDEFDRSLHILDLSDIKERFGYETHSGKFDISAMGRFFLGAVLPGGRDGNQSAPEASGDGSPSMREGSDEAVWTAETQTEAGTGQSQMGAGEQSDRYLYLDCDTAVCASLEQLYNKDLKGNICGAVMEPTIYAQTKKMIGLKKTDKYFNSGVLLIDMKAWREAEIDAKLRAYYRGIDGKSAFCDQDAINAVLKGRILPLPPRYNFFSNYYYFDYSALVKLDRNYMGFSERAFKLAKAHPTVVHYAGDERPWIKGSCNPYGHIYRDYLKMTPWAGTPQEEGKERYMAAYHAMNLMTKFAPGLRRVISEGYAKRLYGK